MIELTSKPEERSQGKLAAGSIVMILKVARINEKHIAKEKSILLREKAVVKIISVMFQAD